MTDPTRRPVAQVKGTIRTDSLDGHKLVLTPTTDVAKKNLSALLVHVTHRLLMARKGADAA